MPLDTSGVVLTVGRKGARRQPQHYPQLATQVRCSSGFTHVPSGRLEALKAQSRPVIVERPALPSHARNLLELLHALACQRESNLSVLKLTRRMGDQCTRHDVNAALSVLAENRLIVAESSLPSAQYSWWMIQIVSTGQVLRSQHAPRDRGPQ